MGLLIETYSLISSPRIKKNHNHCRVFVTLGSEAQTAGPWQEVDQRVKYGWRLALLPFPRVWTKTERLFIAQRPSRVTECVWRQRAVCGAQSDGGKRGANLR